MKIMKFIIDFCMFGFSVIVNNAPNDVKDDRHIEFMLLNSMFFFSTLYNTDIVMTLIRI